MLRLLGVALSLLLAATPALAQHAPRPPLQRTPPALAPTRSPAADPFRAPLAIPARRAPGRPLSPARISGEEGPDWTRTFGSNYAGSQAIAVGNAVDAAGHTYVLGEALHASGAAGVFVAKHDAAGAELWRAWRLPDVNETLDAFAVAIDAAGQPVVALSSIRFTEEFELLGHVLVLRFDADGQTISEASYGGLDQLPAPMGLDVDADGAAYVVGHVYPTLMDTAPDLLALRVTPEGALDWARVIEGGTPFDTGEPNLWLPSFYGLAADPTGGVVAVGAQESEAAPGWPAALAVRFEADGEVAWTHALRPDGRDALAVDVALADDGTALVAGYADYAGAEHPTALPLILFGLDAEGAEAGFWRSSEADPPIAPFAIELGAEGELYVAALSRDPGSFEYLAHLSRHDGVAAPTWTHRQEASLYDFAFPFVLLAVGPEGPRIARTVEGEIGAAQAVVDAYAPAGALQWSTALGEPDALTLPTDLAGAPGGAVSVSGLHDDGAQVAFSDRITGAGTLAWSATFAGASRSQDHATAILATPDGVVTAGNAFGPRNAVAVVVAYDGDGAERWNLLFEPAELVYAEHVDLAPGPGGSVFLSASGSDRASGQARTVLARLSASGAVEWTADVPGRSAHLVTTSDGAALLATAGQGAFYLAKYAAEGTELWQASIAAEIPFLIALAADLEGGAYLAYDPVVFPSLLTLARVDADGEVAWTEEHAELPYYGAAPLAVAADGDAVLLVCAETATGCDASVLRYAPDGTRRWEAAAGKPVSAALATDPTGTTFVVGVTYTGTTGEPVLHATAFSASGTEVWTETAELPGLLDHFPVGIAADERGLYALLNGAAEPDYAPVFLLARFEPGSGALAGVAGSGLTDLAIPVTLTLGPDGTPYAAGTVLTESSTYLLTARYPVGFGTGGEPGTAPDRLALGAGYPNPFTSTTTFTFALPAPGPVVARAYDLLGREVASLADGDFPAGESRIVWATDGLPAGVYLVRLEAGGQALTRKVVKVR